MVLGRVGNQPGSRARFGVFLLDKIEALARSLATARSGQNQENKNQDGMLGSEPHRHVSPEKDFGLACCIWE
jgi:hypothetical protein